MYILKIFKKENENKKHIDTNGYTWKVIKVFNPSDNPKFLPILTNISKVFRTTPLALCGSVGGL